MSQVPEQAAGVIEALAARFGQTGADLWAAYVTRTVAEAQATAFGFATVTFLLWMAFVLYRRGDPRHDDVRTMLFLTAAGMSIGTIVTGLHLWVAMASPEGAALKALLGQL